MQQGGGNFFQEKANSGGTEVRTKGYNRPPQTDQKLVWKFKGPYQTSLLELSSLSGSSYRCEDGDSTKAGTKLSSETEKLESCVSP